jgi:amino acid adenylation domain-containing protein
MPQSARGVTSTKTPSDPSSAAKIATRNSYCMTMTAVESGVGQRRSLDVFFSHSVSRQPDRPALFVSGRYWTYHQLDVECRAIERALDAAELTGTGRNIGLLFGSGVFSYAAVIAIMRSNNVYVPLSPKIPAVRLLKIIEDANIQSIVIDTHVVPPDGLMQALLRCTHLQLFIKGDSSSWFESAIQETPKHRSPQLRLCRIDDAEATSQRRAAGASTELAYIIYTSGSTGIPKGVAIAHESACRCIEKLHLMFPTDERDRFTQFSALSFDVSIADLFLCWKSGGTLYVPPPEAALVPLSFAAKHQLTVWSSVPSLANFLLKLKILKSESLSHLRLTLFAGEALPTELAQAWTVAAPHSRVFNVYGPTECTIYSTYYEYKGDSNLQQSVVPIGAPLLHLRTMIVDEGRAIRDENMPGELWLSGDQLARGYWNNPVATRAAFVRYPLTDPQGEIWYRTGDLVSWQSGVGLLFRGRLDRQVKMRGYRIELQEVESALRDVIGCTVAAVVPLRNSAGMCEEIVAYCDRLGGDEATIKALCLHRLPRYMVPDRIFELDPIPLSDHGKVDYLALAARTARQSA